MTAPTDAARKLCATMTGEGDALCLAKPCDWCDLIESALAAATKDRDAEIERLKNVADNYKRVTNDAESERDAWKKRAEDAEAEVKRLLAWPLR